MGPSRSDVSIATSTNPYGSSFSTNRRARISSTTSGSGPMQQDKRSDPYSSSLYDVPLIPPKSAKSIRSLRRSGQQNFAKSQEYQGTAKTCYTASTVSLGGRSFSSSSPDDATIMTDPYSVVNDRTGSSNTSRRSSGIIKKSSEPKQDKFRDNPEKKKLIKTELCETFPNVHECPFGKSCNYAHSYKELSLKTLKERHENGLININTYRTRPCFTYVATGDCPYGHRCDGIHDPRAASKKKSWLRHYAMKPTNSDINTDVHVDFYSYSTHSSTYHGHPFGPMLYCVETKEEQTTEEEFPIVLLPDKKSLLTNFDSFVHTVCNSRSNPPLSSSSRVSSQASSTLLAENKRLYIALAMRRDYANSLSSYKYTNPTHIIMNEICMVVQTCAFDVGTNDWDIPKKIDMTDFDPTNEFHTIVREIAFGPHLSPTDRPLALYFDIHDKEVHICTSKEIKRSDRTKKKLAMKKKKEESSSRASLSDMNPSYSQVHHPSGCASRQRDFPASFDDENLNINKPFILCVPMDKDCYDFVTELLRQCYSLSMRGIKLHDICNFSDLKESKSKYNNIKKHFRMHHLPINTGRATVDKDTCIPKVDTEYNIPIENDAGRIWERFLNATVECGFGIEESKEYCNEQQNSLCTIISMNNLGNTDKNIWGEDQPRQEVYNLPKLSHSPYFEKLFGNDIGGWSDVIQSSLKKKKEKKEKNTF